MRRKLLLTAAGMILLLWNANAQLSVPNPFAVAFPEPGMEETAPSAPSEWKQDSTWAWSWNTVASAWQKTKRTVRVINNSGQLENLTAILWDFNQSQWINYERYANEYYPDHTTPKYQFRMIWDASDLAYVEVYHAFYESDGDMTEYEAKNYDAATNSYTSGNQTTYFYYPGSMQEIKKNLVPATMNWKNYSRATTTFDGQENPVSYLAELWNESTSSWMNQEYYAITYNTQNQILEIFLSIWDAGANTWNNEAKMTYEYNLSGWLIGQYTYSWDEVGLTWKNGAKILHHYNEGGQETQAESYDWNDASQSWEYDRKEVYSYHANGMRHETFTYSWIAALWQFLEYQYTCLDECGNETETYHKDINYQTNEYYQGYRTVSTYVDNLLTEALDQTLQVPGNTWVPSQQKTNTWDSHRNLTLELYESYDNVNLTWKNSSKFEHFFSLYMGVDENPGLAGICLFQNPLLPGETIRCPGLSPEEQYRFRLITLNGQPVFDQTITGNGTLTVPQHVSPGSYILVIAGSDGKTLSGKVMVIRR